MTLKNYTELQSEIDALNAKKEALKEDVVIDIKNAVEFFGIKRKEVFKPAQAPRRAAAATRGRPRKSSGLTQPIPAGTNADDALAALNSAP